MGGSGENTNFNHTTNLTGIRNSQSFKDLVEVRANTPNNRFSSGSSPFKKRESVATLKQSASTKQIFGNFGRDSAPKLADSRSNHIFGNLGRESGLRLAESRSYDRFRQGVLGSEGGELLCMNNDGKRAKYKVVHDDSADGESELYYCSKCTIPLVKQNFKVEEITASSEVYEHQETLSRNR